VRTPPFPGTGQPRSCVNSPSALHSVFPERSSIIGIPYGRDCLTSDVSYPRPSLGSLNSRAPAGHAAIKSAPAISSCTPPLPPILAVVFALTINFDHEREEKSF